MQVHQIWNQVQRIYHVYENQYYLEQHLEGGPPEIYEHQDYLQQVHLLAVVKISSFLQVLRGLSRV